MTDPIITWWSTDTDRLRRALVQRLRARGHPQPELAATLIATRGRLGLLREQLATVLATAGDHLDDLERGDAHTMTTQDVRDQLRELLNEWDPIGLVELRHDADEYDCMHEALLLRLERGDDMQALVTYLGSELREHFGLDPAERDVPGFVARVSTWHGRVRRDSCHTPVVP